MLQELRVENLLLIDRAELALAPGLNVVTGETGAGKTLLAQALDLLLGGRAGSDVVRSGAAEAYVEGVFSVPPELAGAEVLPTGAEEIVLSDPGIGVYKKLVVADGRLIGAVLFGDTADGPWYLDLIRAGSSIERLRNDLMFGRDLATRVAA